MGRVPQVLGEVRLSSHYAFPLEGHTLIAGMAGTGKSLAACYMAWQLAQLGAPILIIDATGQYAHALKDSFTVYELGINYAVNVWELPVTVLTEIPMYLWGEEAWPDPLHRSTAEHVLEEVRAEGGTLLDAYKRLTEMEKSPTLPREDRISAAKARQALKPLITRGIADEPLEPAARGLDLKYPSIIKLSQIPGWEARAAAALTLVYYVIRAALQAKLKTRHLILLLDEAHKIFRREPEMEHAAATMYTLRKYHVYTCLITRKPSTLPRLVYVNTIHLLAFKQDPGEAKWLAKLLKPKVRDPKTLETLETGECITLYKYYTVTRVKVEPPNWLLNKWETWRPEPPNPEQRSPAQ